MTDPIPQTGNRLLRSLKGEDLKALSAGLQPVDLAKGDLLFDRGDMIDTVYFPHDSIISVMSVMRSGEAIETATIGREGAMGLRAAICPRPALSRVIVQVAGTASRIDAAALHEVWEVSPTLRDLVDRHTEALLGHVEQSVACNALHSVEARFCRWLLSCHDRIDTDRVSLTQEFLADMLGVQRTTVTVVARTLQASGFIRYSRGVVDILDRDALEAISCECYRAVRDTYERLLPPPPED
ncbi:MAG: Crp/Fnr family transcriptional regulator [Caulobacteraceae bacterium]